MTADPLGRPSPWARVRQFAGRRGPREVAWSLAGSGGQMLIGVATTVLLARLLGPAGFGTVAVALAMAFATAGLADVGLSIAFVRLASPEVQSGRPIRHLHTVFLGARLALSGALAAVIAVAADRVMPALRLPGDLPWIAPAAALAGVALAAGGHYTAVLQVARDQRSLALVRLGASLLRLAAYTACALIATRQLMVALAIALLAIPVEAALTSLLAHRRVALWPPVLRPPPRQWLSFSVWAALPAIAYGLIGQTDTVLLAALAGTEETGIWAAVSRISSVLLLGAGAAWSVALPYVTAINDRAQLQRYVRFVRWGAMALAGLTVVALALAPWLTALLYGDAYARGVPALRLLFAGHALGSVTLMLIPVAYRFGRERLVALTGLVQFAVNLGGDLVLIPRAGATGCAAATLLMYLAALAVLVVPVVRDLASGAPLPPASLTPEALA